jgi:hypothetical protein
MNISLLESFSNNFVEAWAMQKPLLTVRDEWAFSAAQHAALYIDIVNGEIDLNSFLEAISTEPSEVISKGVTLLRNYPTAAEKNMQYLEAIERATKLGCLPSHIRRGITL